MILILTIKFYLFIQKETSNLWSNKQIRWLWISLFASLWGLLGLGGLLWGGFLWSGGYNIKVGKLIWFVQRIIKLICKFDEFKLAPTNYFHQRKILPDQIGRIPLQTWKQSRRHGMEVAPNIPCMWWGPGLGWPGRAPGEGGGDVWVVVLTGCFWHCVWSFYF